MQRAAIFNGTISHLKCVCTGTESYYTEILESHRYIFYPSYITPATTLCHRLVMSGIRVCSRANHLAASSVQLA